MLKKSRQKFYFAILFLFALVLLTNIFFRDSASNIFYSLAQKPSGFFWQMANFLNSKTQGLLSQSALQKENQELLKEKFLLSEKIIDLEIIKEENQALKKMLDQKETLPGNFQFIVSQVFAKDIQSDSLFINKGKDDGIIEDMPVLAEGNVLAGRVAESFPHFAKVALITGSKSAFDVEFAVSKSKETRSTAVAKGQGRSKIIIQNISKDLELKVKDIVSTSNLSGKYPRGLLVGEIEKIEKNQAQPFFTATLSPYFLKENLNSLFVLQDFQIISPNE